MKKPSLILTLAFACAIISNALAEPFGEIICSFSVNASNHQVAALNVVTDETQLLTINEEPWTPYNGLGAPPFMGDPCVIQDGEGNHITLLAFDGTKTAVVSGGDGESIDPCFSFDGDMIAYIQKNVSVSNEDVLHVAFYDGTGDTPIYTTPLWDIDIKRPAFSPDGSTIAFGQEDLIYGGNGILTIPVTGGEPQELTSLPAGAMHPAYSPDGKKLACVSKHGGSTFHLFIANADGSNPQQITSEGSFALFPAFSPDSKYIAIMSDNGISIIDLSNNQIVKEIPLDYEYYYGLTWCLGAQDSFGTLTKAKIKSKSISLKLLNIVPQSSPSFGLVQIDNIFMKLDDANLWIDKKGKKYIYNDKINNLTASFIVKNGKGKFTAKKLQLNEGTDYTLMTNITVVINAGNQTLINTIQLDEKGKYIAPK